MSIPPNFPWRGCAAYFPQPMSENDVLAAQCLDEHVYYFNCRIPQEPLADIEYRNSSRELDILCHVFRWDVTPYQQVFENGFNARRQEGTSDEIFFNLDYYVHHGGRPLDSTRATTHAFVSTTISSGWHPTLPDPGTERQVYRYEIYAPGGILVRDSLGDRYKYISQDEVCFVAGIAPQYIRSAQLFRLVQELNSRHTKRVREDNILILNGYFNPQSHPNRLLWIQRPVCTSVTRMRGCLLNLSLTRVKGPPKKGNNMIGHVGSNPQRFTKGKPKLNVSFSHLKIPPKEGNNMMGHAGNNP